DRRLGGDIDGVGSLVGVLRPGRSGLAFHDLLQVIAVIVRLGVVIRLPQSDGAGGQSRELHVQRCVGDLVREVQVNDGGLGPRYDALVRNFGSVCGDLALEAGNVLALRVGDRKSVV